MKRSSHWMLGFAILSFSLACSLLHLPFFSSSNTAEPTKGSATTTPPADISNSPFDTWQTFTNESYGFRLKYPPGGKIQEQSDVYARVGLPFTEGTTLNDKYLEANVYLAADPCASQAYGTDPSKTEKIQIHGTYWLKEEGGSAGAGSSHGWISYSTARGNVCINLIFTIISTNPDMYDPTPPPYDSDAETAVFADIVSTFEWLDS